MSSLPAVDRYLADLPAGLGSYPEALAKMTVMLPWHAGAVGVDLRRCDDLPAPLRALLEQPPPVNAWVPEVTLVGTIEAAYDAHFAHAGGVDALQTYVRSTNRAVFKGPLYSVLFAAVSPERLLVGAAQRWSAFHRGSALQVSKRSAGRAVMDLSHPPNLFSDNALRGHGTSFALAAELAGGREARMSFKRIDATATQYTIEWH